MLEQISQFIQEHFLYLQPGYTLLNTIVFGLILGLVVLGLIKMFKWIDKDPQDLFLPLIPFIFLGSSTRALVDNGIYPLNLLLVTPGIYVLVGILTLLVLFGTILLEKRTGRDYRQVMFLMGMILCLPNIFNMGHINFQAFAAIIGIWLLFTAPFFLLGKKWKLLSDKFNLAALSAHLFDASSTFVAVDYYGYWEQHVLPAALTDMMGTAFIMFPLKIGVILGTIYFIDSEIEDKTIKNMLKLAIFILGLAPGLRNFLSLIMAT
ncbi:DUF63 family protein [Methanobacterium alkalithermotolerans]|uniref:DUF63 family protein n=1 Tax=Methanobacterium alkalithermotolerans TaxID=2731220 RepID=A0A8T8K4H9_9EURY|nr:DUF63 family protein [Methanobacterium alkalithermotolerans]QUH23466.1 DUF63 family protein [Methanobacterium alkalithermotolerans]